MLEQIYAIIKETPIDKKSLINLIPILKEVDELEFYHPAHCYGVLDHSIKAAEILNDEFLRLVLIFHDVGKLNTAIKVPNITKPNEFITKFPGHQQESMRIANEILGDEFDTETLKIFLKLIEYHDTPLVIEQDDRIMRGLIQKYGTNFVSLLLKVQRADMATHDKIYYENKIKPVLDHICDVYEKKYRQKTVEDNSLGER